MKKRKKSRSMNYTNICFNMMAVLNMINILFLVFTIVLTQYRIADSQKAARFLSYLEVIPQRPVTRLVIVLGCSLILYTIIYMKREMTIEFNTWFYILNIMEIILVLTIMKEIDMSYNGIIFLVVAEMIPYVEQRWNRIIIMFIAFCCYILCSYDLVTLFMPANSIETWVSFYDSATEKHFLAMKTICEISIIVVFILYVLFLLLEDQKERQRIQILNKQLQEANDQLHEYAKEKELMGETKERNRLAREIHDTLGHILTGISVGIDAVLVLMDVKPEMAREKLEEIGDTARRGLKDVRRSVRKLKPDALERMSLDNAIRQMIEDMTKVTDTKIYFISYMEGLQFGADEEETIYRIIQESTTNAIRHGNATEIWVRMNEKNDELIIIISDNGIGCDNITEGFGLRHIRERVELLNGEVHYKGMLGFTVIVKIPVRKNTGLKK